MDSKKKIKHQKYLAKGEEIISFFGIGDKFFWYSFASYLVLSFLIVGIPRLLKLVHWKKGLVYILTNRRVLIKEGVFSTKLVSVPYDKITHISVKENFLPRICYGVGDLVIHTAASGSLPVEVSLINIAEPLKVKNMIEELMILEKEPHLIKSSGIVKKLE